ncbi:bifunctional diguanylate cyclase/phosphodiesterase [Paraglaciecola sp.]|uniref:putative bifunctional diguanylate cyclase/phosphodiesterase n=1 Tax=Paraglaciecola sp. TaxID=1920173 RepID=UPI00273D13FB|nr:EAL domain-containing protein [Paraglaciecola sp.]MDP5029636.1 EAL domain-containing protein [Paraglaciecola sp.]
MLQSCCNDPTADLKTQHYYRYRQFIAVLNVIPLASFATYFIAGLGLVTTWQQINLWALGVWALFLIIIASINLVLWRRFVWHKIKPHNINVLSWILTFNLGVAALLYASLCLAMFGLFEDHHRILLVGTAAAFSATGCWMFASMPIAGVLWGALLPGILGIGLLLSYSDRHGDLGLISMLYSLFLIVTVLVTSRKFVTSLIAETKIEQQGELISLLLHDFEENANDWLWEIDSKGFLRHVSVQLINASGKTEKELKKQPVADIIKTFLAVNNEYSQTEFEKITDALAKPLAFNDLRLKVNVNEQQRWWSLKAKPLFDERNRFVGWRGVTSDITAAYSRELEMTRLANIDSLTGLANRYHFLNVLRDLVPNKADVTPCYLMMLDLDNFKIVNDSLGHYAGDQLLVHLAETLGKIIPPSALLARLGGDEFAIIMREGLTQESATIFAHHLQFAIAKPFTLQEYKIEMKASIGISFAPDDQCTAADLLNASDIALYDAKEAGRNKLSFFSPQLQKRALFKQKLLIDLKSAIVNQQFFLLYQPQIDLATGQLVGFEALVRWQHPTEGLISPDDFIPLAETSKLIIELGAWVLQQACRDAVLWPEHLRVAVNVSGVQCEDIRLHKVIHQALVDSGLAQHRLELELTESALMNQSSELLGVLSEFRQAGGTVAIDDFGTGFSSFSYLHSFPLDKLKIDRSFVKLLGFEQSNNKAEAIVQSIILLAKSLDLSLTAEGVETPQQQVFLTKLHCDLAQGYLFSKPISAECVTEYIAEFAPAPPHI